MTDTTNIKKINYIPAKIDIFLFSLLYKKGKNIYTKY